MKLKTLRLLSIILIALIFSNCEKDNTFLDEQAKVVKSIKQERESEIDFTFLENIQNDGTLQKLEAGFLDNIEAFHSQEELSSLVGDYKPNLKVINQFLKFKGNPEIDLKEYHNRGIKMINNENTTAEEFASFLIDNGIYSNDQLKHFLKLDSKMKNELSKEDYLRNIEEFKNNILNDGKLSLIDKNLMLIYGTVVKAFYSTNHFESQKSKCNNCLRRNGWRIFGWGVLFWLITLLPCIATGPIVVGCLLATAGFWALRNIQTFCGWACNWI